MEQNTTWMDIINPYLKSPDMVKLKKRLVKDRTLHRILPPADKTFDAFKLCPYEKTRVVIVGQDPYPDRAHAHGLGFSSLSKTRPASLQNLFIEIHKNLYPDQDFDECFKSNYLGSWAEQGVLLINSCMTVIEGQSGSHRKIGWDSFIEFIFKKLDKHPNNPIFLFLGSQAKEHYRHLSSYPDTISLFAGHPSPLSAQKYFFGCGVFKEINHILQQRFFDDLKIDLQDEDYLEKIATRTQSFLHSRGHQVPPKKDIKANAWMYMQGLLPFMLDQYTSLSKQFEINWRT